MEQLVWSRPLLDPVIKVFLKNILFVAKQILISWKIW